MARLVGLSDGTPIALDELKSQFAWDKVAKVSAAINEDLIRRELGL